MPPFLLPDRQVERRARPSRRNFIRKRLNFVGHASDISGILRRESLDELVAEGTERLLLLVLRRAPHGRRARLQSPLLLAVWQ
jgi:hypothetical protein